MSIKKDFFKLLHKIKSFILQRKFKSFKDNYFKNNFSKTTKLILIFVPADTDRINGGILSICTIHSVIKELKHIHNCDVIASFLPFKNESDYKYRNFENDMIIFTFKEIATYFKDLEFVEIHIPDVMITTFKKENKKMLSFFKWVEQLAMVKVNILNQNDLFMPPSKDIENLKNIFPYITMTVAHEQYLTPEKREYYGMPIHQLSPWLSPIPYKKREFAEKENLILYSPDKIQSVPNVSTITKNKIITTLEKKLKHYKFIEIKNMKYDVYKDYTSRSKFTITFGEGLDGYYTETVYSGGISFAVYNEIFFTKEFENLHSLYKSFDELLKKIVTDINYFENEENYNRYNDVQNSILSKMYSFEKLKLNVEQFYLNNFDIK